jgi:hypothetical protein
MKWYVASSWKNADTVRQVVKLLREQGEEVYDFTHHSFDWADLEVPDEKLKAMIDGRDRLPDAAWFAHPLVQEHFKKDIEALKVCDALVAIFPAGNSTHIEIGYAAGRGCHCYAIAPEGLKRDLLYRLFKGVYKSPEEFITRLTSAFPGCERPTGTSCTNAADRISVKLCGAPAADCKFHEVRMGADA